MVKIAALGAASITIAVLLAGGVRPGELALLVLYQVGFVVGPGLWLVRPLSLPSATERLGAAWVLGTVAVALVYVFARIADIPELMWMLPVLCLAEARHLWHVRWRPPPLAKFEVLALLSLFGLGALLLWLGFFGQAPLTRGLASGAHYPDLVFHLALAAEVLEQAWPFQDPSVAGERLRYQLLPHLDAAAASFVTGVDLEVVFWRSQPVLALMAGGALAAGLGRRLGLSGVSVIAPVLLLLFAGELFVGNTGSQFGIGGSLLGYYLLSPTHVLAVPLLLTLLGAFTTEHEGGRKLLGVYALLGFGAMAAKVTVLPVVLAGVVFAALLVRRRQAISQLVAPVSAVLAGAGAAWVLFYLGSGGGGLAFGPLDVVGGQGLERLGLIAVLPFVVLAPAAGIVGYLAIRRPPREDLAVWVPVGALLASLVPYLLLSQPGKSQIYFLLAGLTITAPVSAAGAVLVLRELKRFTVLRVVATGIAGAALLIASLVVARAAGMTHGALFVLLGMILLAVVLSGAIDAGRGIAKVAVAFCLLLTVFSLPDPFLDGGTQLRTVLKGDPLHRPDDERSGRGITQGVRAALVWIRGHSRPSEVLATNNAVLAPNDARYFYYTALARRRVFLGGWAYSADGAGGQNADAYSERRDLNSAAFRGDRDSLRRLAVDHGVTMLLVDRRYGELPPSSSGLRQIYSNREASVLALGPRS